jgi:LuxR family maltose regulon positive regulatory protein
MTRHSPRKLRPTATYALPYYSVQARLELACAYLALADLAAAREVLREVDDLLRWRPDLGTLSHQANQLRSHLTTSAARLSGRHRSPPPSCACSPC